MPVTLLPTSGPTTGWTEFTPDINQMTVGNATLFGAYWLDNGLCHIIVWVKWGSTTAFTGNPSLTLPVLPVAYSPVLTASFTDNSAFLQTWPGVAIVLTVGGTTAMLFSSDDAAGGSSFIAAAAPFTWAVDDRISITGSYWATV